jgi:uncharacterized RDD family membrane protein YckC
MTARALVSPLSRWAAMGVDLAWLVLVSVPWLWATSPAGGWQLSWAWAAGLLLLSLGAVPCWCGFGATPGQLLLSQRVVDAGGAPRVSVGQALLRWFGSWASLLPLGLGLLWIGQSRHRQGWHDKLAATLVVVHEPDDRSRPYWRRHLAGELPLAHSLWVNGLLWPLPLLLVLGALDAWTRLYGSGLRWGSAVLVLGWLGLLALMVGVTVGVWRAAGTGAGVHASAPAQGQRRLQGLLARGVMVTAALLVGLQWGLSAAPQLAQRLSLVAGQDPLGQASLRLSSDGRRLHVEGPLGLGEAGRVWALMDTAPQLRLLVIESGAGRLAEALRIAEAVRARGLATRASGLCSGVCPLVFLAGTTRQLLPGAQLALHRLPAGGVDPPYQRLVNGELAHHLAQAGLTPHLVTKAMATPPTRRWVPGFDELSAARLLTVPERPLDVDLPDPQGATAADYAEALSASPLWQALEQRFAGVQGLTATAMEEAGRQGADAVQAVGQQTVSVLLPALLARASPETRWLYTELLLAQIDALRAVDAGLCRQLLLGDAGAHRRLPQDLAWREAQWLLATLDETPRSTPARRPSALELEVIRRTLGPRAPAQLAALWRPAATQSQQPDCERASALLTELRLLPAPERRLALRLMYERD